jgi:hypothetical protein
LLYHLTLLLINVTLFVLLNYRWRMIRRVEADFDRQRREVVERFAPDVLRSLHKVRPPSTEQ